MNTKQLRQKILDLAIRGKLVPQDPSDEPASVLLARVKAEKERLIAEGKIKRSKKRQQLPISRIIRLKYQIPGNGLQLEKLLLAFYTVLMSQRKNLAHSNYFVLLTFIIIESIGRQSPLQIMMNKRPQHIY